MSIQREGVHLAAAETDTDIRSLGDPINEAIDTPLDTTETYARIIRNPFRRPAAPRAPEGKGKGGQKEKGKKSKSTELPHTHGYKIGTAGAGAALRDGVVLSAIGLGALHFGAWPVIASTFIPFAFFGPMLGTAAYIGALLLVAKFVPILGPVVKWVVKKTYKNFGRFTLSMVVGEERLRSWEDWFSVKNNQFDDYIKQTASSMGLGWAYDAFSFLNRASNFVLNIVTLNWREAFTGEKEKLRPEAK